MDFFIRIDFQVRNWLTLFDYWHGPKYESLGHILICLSEKYLLLELNILFLQKTFIKCPEGHVGYSTQQPKIRSLSIQNYYV